MHERHMARDTTTWKTAWDQDDDFHVRVALDVGHAVDLLSVPAASTVHGELIR